MPYEVLDSIVVPEPDTLKLVQEAAGGLQQACEGSGSQLLESLLTPGMRFPEMQATLEQLTSATDWEAACETGQIVPSKVGVLMDS